MATEPTADALRDMAAHRGFKLLRSRKRTPGAGDYGKFGLTDAAGKPLLGVSDEGLTATPTEIEQYLRGGTVSSWKLSAETTPERPPPKREPAPETEEKRADGRSDQAPASPRKMAPPARRRQDPPPPHRAKPVLRLVEPEIPAEPDVTVRAATAKDSRGIAALMAQLADAPKPEAVARHVAMLLKAKGGLIVAERRDLVGCCAWAVVPTIQRGPVGRISLILVEKGERRRGIATAMLTAAEERLAKSGCEVVEAMSDIMVANSHNFFRSLSFEQRSYRFVRPIGKRPAK